jgi:hypothetical protein
MYATTFKHLQPFLFVCGLMIFSTLANAQDNKNQLKLMAGLGCGHYFNTSFDIENEDIRNNNPNFNLKLLWQPEHRLRIGIESGYNTLYSTNKIQTDSGSLYLNSRLNIVPLFLTLSMQMYKHLEASFSTGYASLLYNIDSDQMEAKTGNVMSKYNIAVGLLYNYPINNYLDIGSEIKYLYIGQTFDKQLSFSVNFSYRFLTW